MLDEKRLDVTVREWMRECGQELQKRRGVNKWSQGELAELAGVHTTTICRAELGRLMPKDSVRMAIASALCCEVNDIWMPPSRRYIMSMAGRFAA